MSILLAIFFWTLGVFLFSWTLWKKLREDYPSEQIFSFTLGVLGLGLLGLWVSSSFWPTLSFWIALASAVLGGVYFMRKYSFRFFEVVDAAAPAWFWLLLFLFGGAAAREEGRLFFLSEAGLSLIALFVYGYLEKKYRLFVWYPSGRMGFPGMVSLAFYLGLRSVVEFLPFNVIFSSQTADALIGAGFALLLLVITYLRSGREKAEVINERLSTVTEIKRRGR